MCVCVCVCVYECVRERERKRKREEGGERGREREMSTGHMFSSKARMSTNIQQENLLNNN